MVTPTLYNESHSMFEGDLDGCVEKAMELGLRRDDGEGHVLGCVNGRILYSSKISNYDLSDDQGRYSGMITEFGGRWHLVVRHPHTRR